MEVSDEQLARNYVEDNELKALDTLIDRHIANVRNLVFQMVLNEADADDITQEVFIKTAAALVKFKYRSSFKTWLYRIAVNTVRDFMRKRKNGRLVLYEKMPEISVAADTNRIMSQEEAVRLLKLIERLSPCLRRAFVLVGVNEMAPGEAAKLEGCLAATMYRRVHVARRRLQEWLKEDDQNEQTT